MNNTGLFRIFLGSVCSIVAACGAGDDLAADNDSSGNGEIASLSQDLIAADRGTLIINVDHWLNTTPSYDPPWPTGYCLESPLGGAGGQPIRVGWCNDSNEQRWAFEPVTSRIVNAQSGLCLQTRLQFPADGTKLMAATCNSASQIQRWEHTVGGTFRQKSSGKCMEIEKIEGSLDVLGSLVQVRTCNTGGYQKFRPWNTILKSAASGRCIDVNASNGDQARIWDCTGGQNQLWGQLYGSTVNGILIGADSGRCLTATGPTRGSPVVMADCVKSGSQNFTLREDGSLYNWGNRLCLDVTNNATGNGSPLQLWTCNGAANQRWSTR